MQLQALFDDIGPVRQAFIVTSKGDAFTVARACLHSVNRAVVLSRRRPTRITDGPTAGSSKGFGFVQLCVRMFKRASPISLSSRYFLRCRKHGCHVASCSRSASRDDAVQAAATKNGFRFEGRAIQVGASLASAFR